MGMSAKYDTKMRRASIDTKGKNGQVAHTIKNITRKFPPLFESCITQNNSQYGADTWE